MGYPMRWEDIAPPEVIEQTVEQTPARSASMRRHFVRLAAITLVGSALLVGAVVAVSSIWLRAGGRPDLRLDSGQSSVEVGVSTPKTIRRVGFVSVAGDVANRTKHALDRIEAVVDLLDRENYLLSTQSAMVTLHRIAPGESSPYQVTLKDDARATAYRVHFRKLYGAALK